MWLALHTSHCLLFKPAFWGAGWPLPSPPTPLKFPPERRKRLASFADDAFFFFWLFIFKPREVTELLRRWCMGGCWSGQMGKCNYRCLRASGWGGKEGGGRLSQRRVQETTTAPFVMRDNSRKKLNQGFYLFIFLHKAVSLWIGFPPRHYWMVGVSFIIMK